MGLALARVSGKPARDQISSALLEPLGMDATVWDGDAVAPKHLAAPHHFDEDAKDLAPANTGAPGALETAGGLYSTVADLSLFAAWQLSAWPPRGKQQDAVLHRASLREAQTIHHAIGGTKFGAHGVGWAWHVVQRCFGEVVQHGGGIDGFRAQLDLMPNHGVAVIVLMNTGLAKPQQISTEILEKLHATGGLQPRVVAPHDELELAARTFVDMFNDWDAEVYKRHASDGLQRSLPAEVLEEELAWERQQVGRCQLDALRASRSVDHAKYALRCEHAEAELALNVQIRDGEPTLWNGFSLTEHVPPHADVQKAAEAALALRASWNEKEFERIFAPHWVGDRIQRFFEKTNEKYGSCRLGDALMVRGPHQAKFQLECDVEAARMMIAVAPEGETKQISAIRIVPAKKTRCEE